MEERDRNKEKTKRRTFIARHLSLDNIADLAAGGEVRDYERRISTVIVKDNSS
jgi:hypothetical protein